MSDLTRHTAGPWKDVQTNRGIEIAAGSDGYILNLTPNGRGIANFMANARLVSAAPELLESLIQLREWIRSPGEDDGLLNDSIILAADAVIQKAKGKEIG